MVEGEYYNIFGITKLCDDYSKIRNSDKEKLSAYLHERIHYIQNFTTVYGVYKALISMSDYLGRVLQIQQGKFPNKPYDREDQEFISALFNFADGASFSSDGNMVQCHAIEKIVEVDNYSDLEYDKDFPEYSHLFKKQMVLEYDGGQEYEFGAFAISESMAYLFEQLFFDSDDYSHRFPYNACDLVYQHIMHRKNENISVMIGLCYVALMTRCPGTTFVELLYLIRDKNIELNSVQSVFDFAETVIEKVDERIINEVLKKLDLVFPVERDNPMEILEEESQYARDWLKEKYKNIAGNELAYRKALIWVLDEVEPDKKLLAMFRLLDEYGQPIIIDSNGKLYCGENKKLTYVLAPMALFNVIIYKKSECFLYRVCMENGGHPDEDCKKCCWKHKSESEICLLRYYLYKMGLGDIQFEYLENSPFQN